MAEGTIVVRAYTSRASIPVVDATIIFSQIDRDGRQALLAVRQTDQSGRTAPVTVSTPDRSDSQVPEPGQPYALIRIDAHHPGYERILVENVQVFDGVQTLQELAMIPLEEYPASRNQTETFDLPTQNL